MIRKYTKIIVQNFIQFAQTRKRFFTPMLSAWIVILYIHGLQYLCIQSITIPIYMFIILFIPISIYEWFISRWFYKKKIEFYYDHNHKENPVHIHWIKQLIVFFGNTMIWFLLYLFLVIFVAIDSKENQIIQSLIPDLMTWLFLLVKLNPIVSFILLLVWLFLYYILSIRLKKMRIMSSVMIPMIIFLFLFMSQSPFGSENESEIISIMKQKGIEQIISLDELREKIYPFASVDNKFYGSKIRSEKAVYQPIDLYVEPKGPVIFSIIGNPHNVNNMPSPAILKKDLTTGNMSYMMCKGNIVGIDISEQSIYIAPWRNHHIYEIGKENLEIIKKIPYQTQRLLARWEPMSIVKDYSKNRLYVTNNMHPALLVYNLDSNILVDLLDFTNDRIIQKGGFLKGMIQSPKTRMLYLMAYPGQSDLFEIDPDKMIINRSLDFSKSLSTITLNPQGNELYCQSSVYDQLYRVSLDTFSIQQTYQGEYKAKSIQIDPKRQAIYVLGYMSGTIFSVDLKTGKKIWSIKVGNRPNGMVHIEPYLWIHSMFGVFRINLQQVWRFSQH